MKKEKSYSGNTANGDALILKKLSLKINEFYHFGLSMLLQIK